MSKYHVEEGVTIASVLYSFVASLLFAFLPFCLPFSLIIYHEEEGVRGTSFAPFRFIVYGVSASELRSCVDMQFSPVSLHRTTPAVSMCFVVAILFIPCVLSFKDHARLILTL
jgi:hypothetical protein